MSTVVFWSPVNGRGTSSHLILSALMITLTHHVRVLSMHMNKNGDSIEAALPVREESMDHMTNIFTITGWDALLRLHLSGNLTRDKFRDYTVPLSRQLDLLPGARVQSSLDVNEEYAKYIPSVLKTASEVYDLVMLDAGNRDRMERDMMKDADVVVVNLDQNLRVLENYFGDTELKEQLESKKVIVTVGQYDADSHCTVNNIKRRFNYKHPVVAVPYCTEFKDAWNRRDVPSYLQQNMNLDKKNGQRGEHASSIRELAKCIMDNAGLRTILKQLERGA
ncbi:hypothetical protein ACFQ3J_03350 [Paenibacillus provencensis]|uniref:Cellulose biosynthesis protein BcsQ n=1 Tax=Paenibacillus provencensis TaxID=441151 RepID=A0ABW3PPF2_9BACL|nr:hypothetical protein [Paenibacillus sp. MER 78]MCM3126690.1 hypothetical protein [Paenibacillus sp. MER 78]